MLKILNAINEITNLLGLLFKIQRDNCAKIKVRCKVKVSQTESLSIYYSDLLISIKITHNLPLAHDPFSRSLQTIFFAARLQYLTHSNATIVSYPHLFAGCQFASRNRCGHLLVRGEERTGRGKESERHVASGG